MIETVARIHPEQETFNIEFPKENESYKVASPEFKTDLNLAPKMPVKVSGVGIVAKMSGTFGDEKDTVRWTVVLDSCELEVIE